MHLLTLAVTSPLLRVVEIGAGTAIPSAAVLSLRAQHSALSGDRSSSKCRTIVVAQDLNSEALTQRTGPSLLLATTDPSDVSLVAGSWGPRMDEAVLSACKFPPTGAASTGKEAFLLIASETVYRAEEVDAHTGSLLAVLDGAWKAGCRPCIGIVAAKRFYFGDGLGGGSTAFIQAVSRAASTRDHDATSSCPSVARVAHVDDGASNVRDVVAVWLSGTTQ
jgi:hypothetical protein